MKKKTKKRSIKNARTATKKRYSQLLKKKVSKKRMTKREKSDLDKALFVNYCKCIKKLKYSKEYENGLEYPICLSSVYKKRGLKPPKDIKEKCKQYY
jgi:excinuclease UvrABC helicase subunit UvrB